jgi:hypothetical protein
MDIQSKQLLEKQRKSTIVMLSKVSHTDDFIIVRFLTAALVGVTAYSVHPGFVRTSLQNSDPSILGRIMRTLMNVGATDVLGATLNSLYSATSPQAPAVAQGKYLEPVGKVIAKAEPWLSDKKGNQALWEHGEAQVKKLAQ